MKAAGVTATSGVFAETVGIRGLVVEGTQVITAASVAIAGVIVLAGRLSSPSVGTDGCS